jgi:glycosyltransferase involved in cell wall biosynthesis
MFRMTTPDSMQGSMISPAQVAPVRRPRVAVVQDGARNHYATPVALHRAAILECMFTDFFIKSGSVAGRISSLFKGLGFAMRANDRRCKELDMAMVVQSYWLTARQRIQRLHHEPSDVYYQRMAALTERHIMNHGFGPANALTGFVLNISHGLCAAARRQGLVTVADQMIAPTLVLRREAAIQSERWPGWEQPEPPEGFDRLRRCEQFTWDALDHITCSSDYVRLGLLEEGVPGGKTSVIHYPIDETSLVFQERRDHAAPVVVGFVGAVGLRKGAPYFFEVAKRFNPKEVRFVMVGPVHLNKWAVAKFAGHVEVMGGVPRSQVASWLRKFDIMLFPSTCEGSANALMEAMASGLPVVTSPNSGSVARHGREGFLAAHNDSDALTGYLRELVEDPQRRLEMGRAARQRCEQFNLDYYSRELSALFYRLVGSQPGSSARGQ